jgi:hypothetical protein
MTKIVANRPQEVSDSQWLLTWQGASRSDTITVLLDGDSHKLNPFPKESQLALFSKPDVQSNGLIIDLSRVPSGVEKIEFTIDSLTEGERSWTIEGLNTGEIWQNESVEVPADAPCLLLTMTKSTDQWSFTARDQVLGEQTDVVLDDQIPEAYRALVVRATARNLAQSRDSFSAIVDCSLSTRIAEQRGDVQKILAVLVAIAAAANLRPLSVSYHGNVEGKFTVEDNLDDVHSDLYTDALSKASTAPALHALVPKIVSNLRRGSVCYVITDSMFFYDDDLTADLNQQGIELRVLLLSSQAAKFQINEGEGIKLLTLGSLEGLDEKAVLERFS